VDCHYWLITMEQNSGFFIYRFYGKQIALGLGIYPDTSLENARRQAENARKQIVEGINSVDIRNKAKVFKELARQNKKRQN